MKKLLSLALLFVIVPPAFAARKLSEPKAGFSSRKAYNTQVVRAENDPKQAYVLACACESGKSYISDYAKWLKISADGGVADAEYKMAKLYEEDRTIREAVALYKRATAQGLVEAQCKLASLYRTGVIERSNASSVDKRYVFGTIFFWSMLS